ncbi:hypothetical protein [Phytopseudomonas dryadis]|uniref:hypothetical protein n=1 Tax=Phytopseudomonas dryadis TaxID=2487520 RepID=UPI0013F14F18|nr:hypothetical protein [Pseudomonas dryadis]
MFQLLHADVQPGTYSSEDSELHATYYVQNGNGNTMTYAGDGSDGSRFVLTVTAMDDRHVDRRTAPQRWWRTVPAGRQRAILGQLQRPLNVADALLASAPAPGARMDEQSAIDRCQADDHRQLWRMRPCAGGTMVLDTLRGDGRPGVLDSPAVDDRQRWGSSPAAEFHRPQPPHTTT